MGRKWSDGMEIEERLAVEAKQRQREAGGTAAINTRNSTVIGNRRPGPRIRNERKGSGGSGKIARTAKIGAPSARSGRQAGRIVRALHPGRQGGQVGRSRTP